MSEPTLPTSIVAPADGATVLSDKELAQVRLFIGTPTYNATVGADYCVSLLELTRHMDECGVSWVYHAPNGEMVARARNRLIADFLETDCTHMVQIDSDIGFPPYVVTDMLRVNVHVIGALYPLKQIGWRQMAAAAARANGKVTAERLQQAAATFCYNAMPGTLRVVAQGKGRVTLRHGAMEVGVIGTGLFLVSRPCLETMIAAYPHTAYADDVPATRGRRTWALFDYGVEGDRYLSEDYRFCVRWRAIGGTVWGWPWAELRHTGAHLYRGCFGARLTRAPEATARNTNNKEVTPCH